LLGYDPSNLCTAMKKSKPVKISNRTVNSTNQEIMIVGTNNKFYRGQVDSCEIVPMKKNNEEKQMKIKKLQEEKTDIHFDELIQTKNKLFDENLFEYLDWQTEFNEQVSIQFEICRRVHVFFLFLRIYPMNFAKTYLTIGCRLFATNNHLNVHRNRIQL